MMLWSFSVASFNCLYWFSHWRGLIFWSIIETCLAIKFKFKTFISFNYFFPQPNTVTRLWQRPQVATPLRRSPATTLGALQSSCRRIMPPSSSTDSLPPSSPQLMESSRLLIVLCCLLFLSIFVCLGAPGEITSVLLPRINKWKSSVFYIL